MDHRLAYVTSPAALLALALALAQGGCLEPRELPSAAAETCTGCHGSQRDPAPPSGIWTRTDDGGVGAHQAHLKGSAKIAEPLPCAECHTVPTAVEDPGHMDTPLPAEVLLGPLSTNNGTVKASYDPKTKTCTVYCHGATLSGGTVAAPGWDKPGQAKCGACHGLPPTVGHPAATSCQGCHDQVVDSSMKIKDPKLHINGKVEIDSTVSCSTCHGSADNDAPPVDTQGNSDTSGRGVGAHQAHVKAGTNHAALACDECHITPTAVTDTGHMDTPLPAEVTFGKLAKGELRSNPPGLKPSWDGTALTCANTYCHKLDGAGTPTPSWTKPQQMVCGSCHGLPPLVTLGGGGHTPSSLANCTTCHISVIDATGAIIAPDKHVNGVVDF